MCPAAQAEPGPDDYYWKYLAAYGVNYHGVFDEQALITQAQATCFNIGQSPTKETYEAQIDRLVGPNFPREDARGLVNAAINSYCGQYDDLIYQ